MFRFGFILSLASFFILTSCSDNSTLLDAGVSKELAALRKSQISNVEYHLSFDIPANKEKEIKGKVSINFDSEPSSEDLILDFNTNDSSVLSVKIDNTNVPFDYINEHVVIEGKYINERNKIDIEFIAGDLSLNRKEDFLYTLFVPDRAATCFPLFDQPDIKAKYSLELTIPSYWKAVANSKVINQKKAGEKLHYTFEKTLPISSYLFAFAAGEFKVEKVELNGRETRLYHRETDSAKVAKNLNAIFDWHAKSQLWLENYTGIDYSFNKLDYVLLPAFQYNGMEHPGAIFYKASSLFLDENASDVQKLNRARLIAHEVAHMWFGNLVTMKWFDDVWLKEVFANFMAAKIIAPSFSEINHELQFILSHYPKAYEVDRTLGTHPISQNLDNLKNAGFLYGNIIYQKAPIVMDKLERIMGEEEFQNGIRTYLATYSFGNATWDQLITILADQTDKDLKQWNKDWVEREGMPAVDYRKGSKGLIFFHQNNNTRKYWHQSLTSLINDSATHTIYFDNYHVVTDVGTVNHLLPNSNSLGYGYFKIDSASAVHYMNKVDSMSNPIQRSAIWMNFYEGAIRGNIDRMNVLKTMIRNLSIENEQIVLNYLCESIEILYWQFLTEKERKAISPSLEGVLLNGIVNRTEAGARSTMFHALCKVFESEQAWQVLYNIWNGNLELEDYNLSKSDQTQLAYQLSMRNEEKADSILNYHETELDNPDELARFQFVRQAITTDPDERLQFFNSLKQPENRENEEWVLESLRLFNHPLMQDQSINQLEASLELLEEIKLTGDIFFPKRWLDAVFQGHNSEEAYEVVKNFLYQNHNMPQDLKNKLLQSSDLLFRSNNHFTDSNN
ncbi:M1 family metallopeptidase [Fulvivirga lutea]|uniref:Aminopeptidase N n=1 Tax=Fulvivirga lutea TaxID=2810512 RepID=A0A974ZZV7_9BACT|nr:M1 family aminopeptidase [Fulvivirga lutea]QSE96576.1 peptidase M1 [Fulvivirga lutea]